MKSFLPLAANKFPGHVRRAFESVKVDKAVILDLKQLKQNLAFIEQIKNSFNNVHWIYPLKACTQKQVLELLPGPFDAIDVSNKNEASLLESINLPLWWTHAKELKPNEIKNLDVINIDSKNDLNKFSKHPNLALRVNTDFLGNTSRFGIGVAQAIDLARYLKPKYIHFHHGYENNDEGTYIKMAEQVLSIESASGHPFKGVNFGGGLAHIPMEVWPKLITKLQTLLPGKEILFEAGRALFNECVWAYGKVLDVKEIHGRHYVVTNLSRDVDLKWAFCKLINNNYEISNSEVTIGGPTCHEQDTLGVFRFTPDSLKIGDPLYFSGIGPYSAQFAHAFNGVQPASWIIIDE